MIVHRLVDRIYLQSDVTLGEMSETPEFPLPQVAQALQPFIKTRQEALRIRRILSLYLASTIEGLPDGNLHFCLPVSPSSEVRVKNIPSRITGLRRDYLLALQANSKARDEYKAISERISGSSNHSTIKKSSAVNHDASAAVSTYLELLEAERKHEKLNIVHDYIDELRKKDVAKQDYFTLASVKGDTAPTPDRPFTAGDDMSTASSEESQVQALTIRLQKALLRANTALETERRLLAETKSKYQDYVASEGPPEPNPMVKVQALTRTRDELISWIEDRLAKINDQDDEVADNPTSEPPDKHVDIEQQKTNIQRLYNDYLDVRKKLIKLSRERRPIHPMPHPTIQRSKASKPLENTQYQPKQEASRILPYITEHLIPAADAQRAMHQQKAHILNSLGTQHKSTANVLDKLADESHLLAKYPIQSDQPFQKYPTPILGGPNLSPSPFGTEPQQDGQTDLEAKGQMWASAADAARTATNAAVREHLEHGEKHMHAAQTSLAELQTLLNGGEVNREGEEEDIWVQESGVRGSKHDAAGPWRGLDGQIGIERNR